ncbi:MAG: hypoxanthine phosphoribosyltransferase [Oscillospiraceae bacterium]|nr:hypoxanthine phosphoribosyltransferase [Oscillospiraceae bacterium]
MNRLGEVIVSRERISNMVNEIAGMINADYAGKELMLVGVLKGAMIFLADLCRAVDIPVIIDFIIVSSYGVETKTSGVVLLRKDIDEDIKGKHVVIVEDIIDTGVTLNYLKDVFESRNPASFKICSAFDKPSRRVVELVPDYCGIKIPDEFVVGYGLDYAGMYRNLPDVRVLYND